MIAFLPSATAAVLYFAAAFLPPSWRRRNRLLWLGGAAALIHGAQLAEFLITPQGLQLTTVPTINLVCWCIILLTLGGLLRRLPLEQISAIPFFLAALAATLGIRWQLSPLHATEHLGWLTTLHLLISLLAYGVFLLAALQALAFTLLERQLRRHRTTGIVRLLPPLQTMEEILFAMIGIAVLLLTFAVLSGFFFPLRGALLFKSLLSILAWTLFVILLWGRHHLGWRSGTATRWILSGLLVLFLLYYFGPQFTHTLR